MKKEKHKAEKRAEPVKIGVISGKGGTGKTTISISIAYALAKKGYKTGLLDVDLTGPNVSDILGKKDVEVVNDRMIPAENLGIKYLSLGQIASEGDPILWGGKDIESASRQLLERTNWGNLDYIIVDFPPGTGSEPQALIPCMDYVVIVTIPSVLSESNVKRMIEMCREKQVPILGLIKNMTRFKCPNCNMEYNVFPEDHSFKDIPTLAEFPIDPKVAENKIINHFPIEKVLDAMKNPIILKPRKRSIRRLLIELFIKKMG